MWGARAPPPPCPPATTAMVLSYMLSPILQTDLVNSSKKKKDFYKPIHTKAGPFFLGHCKPRIKEFVSQICVS